MKHITVLLFVAAALTSCNFVSASNEALESFSNFKFEVKDNDDGPVVTKIVEISDFTAIEINGKVEIDYSTGSPYLKVEATQKVLDNYTFSVKDAVLVITPKKDKGRNPGKLEITASSNVLEEIEVNGACDFKAKTPLVSDNFRFECNGAGDIECKHGIKAGKVDFEINGAGDVEIEYLDCAKLVVEINGAGDAEISGKAGSAKVDISGAGSIDVRELECPSFSKSVSGVGKIRK